MDKIQRKIRFIFSFLIYFTFFLSIFAQEEKSITIETEPEGCQVKVFQWVPFTDHKGTLLIEGKSPLKISVEKLKDIKRIVIRVEKEGYLAQEWSFPSPYEMSLKLQLQTDMEYVKKEEEKIKREKERIEKEEGKERKGADEFISNFKPGSEPDGFRGIKWGTNINTLPDMVYLDMGRFADDDLNNEFLNVYTRKGDELKMGNATLKEIKYWFLFGPGEEMAFFGVLISTEGFVNFENLKKHLFEKFGRGYQLFGGYYWFGENTNMVLSYDKISKRGYLRIFSKKMADNPRKYFYDKRKAEEGAEKGF